jgi:nicotinate dehydrogenase subunit A
VATGFKLNGEDVTVDVDDDTRLLYVLRNDFAIDGPRFGCGLGQCGACTVHIDGVPARSCLTRLSTVADRSVSTLESLGTPENPHPLQQAFIEEQALQCGYCANGMLMTASALLQEKPNPTDGEIRMALQGHLCRCGAQPRIIKAVARAAELSRQKQ